MMGKVPVIVFESKERPGMYLSNGIEFGDSNGEVGMDEIEKSYAVVRKDLKTPTKQDLDEHLSHLRDWKRYLQERFGKNAFVSMDPDELIKQYNPINITITVEQYNIMAEINEWELVKG